MLLIRDIASPGRTDTMFPYIRCFDKYAGHSWASGDANFADGNNQESSSESLNAWYGMMLWGEATGDKTVRDTGLSLFNTERTAVEEYWFDVSGTNFPKDFPQVALGMIWGGKGAFATWFSGDIDCIHGINWLPFTPASIYMGRHPDYVKKNHDRIVEKREGRRMITTTAGATSSSCSTPSTTRPRQPPTWTPCPTASLKAATPTPSCITGSRP